jgi:hypothetical protein
VLLLLLEPPDVALPPLVLLLPVVLPELESCELLFVILRLLSQFMSVLFDWLLSMLLVEPGPVLLILGSAAATPTTRLAPTTDVVKICNNLFIPVLLYVKFTLYL